MKHLMVALLASSCLMAGDQVPKKAPTPKVAKSTVKSSAFGFKEYQIGMLFKDIPLTKGTHDGEKPKKTGSFKDTIAGEECLVSLSFEDYGKGLQLDFINVTADKSAFSTIVGGLKAKYGAPTSARAVSKMNDMGATLEGNSYVWMNSTSKIEAQELGPQLDKCRIVWSARGLGTSKAAKPKKAGAASDL